MLAITTLIISIPIVLIIYHVVIKNVKYSLVSYITVILVSFLFFIIRSVHLIYIGLEVLLIGIMVAFIKHKYFAKNKVTTK